MLGLDARATAAALKTGRSALVIIAVPALALLLYFPIYRRNKKRAFIHIVYIYTTSPSTPCLLYISLYFYYYEGANTDLFRWDRLPFICRPLWTMRPNPGASKSNVSKCMTITIKKIYDKLVCNKKRYIIAVRTSVYPSSCRGPWRPRRRPPAKPAPKSSPPRESSRPPPR